MANTGLIGLSHLLDTRVTPREQFGGTLRSSFSVVFLALERLATIFVHWVEFSPPMKLQNGCMDSNISSAAWWVENGWNIFYFGWAVPLTFSQTKFKLIRVGRLTASRFPVFTALTRTVMPNTSLTRSSRREVILLTTSIDPGCWFHMFLCRRICGRVCMNNSMNILSANHTNACIFVNTMHMDVPQEDMYAK